MSGGSHRHGIYQLDDAEVFDLTWLNSLSLLRYLHIQAFRHTTRATLQSLGVLPLPVSPSSSSFWSLPIILPDFVRRIEELGLDLYCEKVGLERAVEFTFDGWTRLRRCAVRYMTLAVAISSFHPERQYISPQREAANAILRERVGAKRWVSEEDLVSGRWDSIWKKEMASGL